MPETEFEKNASGPAVRSGRLFKLFFWGVLLCLFAAALLSYTPADAAVLYGGVVREPDNWIGWSGAWLADQLFMHLGLGVYLLLVLAVAGAVRSALGTAAGGAYSRWQGIGGALLTLSGALLLFGGGALLLLRRTRRKKTAAG